MTQHSGPSFFQDDTEYHFINWTDYEVSFMNLESPQETQKRGEKQFAKVKYISIHAHTSDHKKMVIPLPLFLLEKLLKEPRGGFRGWIEQTKGEGTEQVMDLCAQWCQPYSEDIGEKDMKGQTPMPDYMKREFGTP